MDEDAAQCYFVCLACMRPWAWFPTLPDKQINKFPFLSVFCGIWPSVVNLAYYPASLRLDLFPSLSFLSPLPFSFSFSFLAKVSYISGWHWFARMPLNFWPESLRRCPPILSMAGMAHHNQFQQFRNQVLDFTDARQALYQVRHMPRPTQVHPFTSSWGKGQYMCQTHTTHDPWHKVSSQVFNVVWCEIVI